jgi:hypothetical protein
VHVEFDVELHLRLTHVGHMALLEQLLPVFADRGSAAITPARFGGVVALRRL